MWYVRVDRFYIVSQSFPEPALVTEMKNGSHTPWSGIEVMEMPAGPDGAVQEK